MDEGTTVLRQKWPRWSVLTQKKIGEEDEADFAADCFWRKE
jgi:hypothetical protein